MMKTSHKNNNKNNKTNRKTKTCQAKTTVTFPSTLLTNQARRVLLLKPLPWTLKSHSIQSKSLTISMLLSKFIDLKDKSRDTQALTSPPLMKEFNNHCLNTWMDSALTNTWLPSLNACHSIRIKDSTCNGSMKLRTLSTNEKHERRNTP